MWGTGERPNLHIITIDKGEESQNSTDQTLNRILEENFPKLKTYKYKYKRNIEHQIDKSRKEILTHIIVKTLDVPKTEH